MYLYTHIRTQLSVAVIQLKFEPCDDANKDIKALPKEINHFKILSHGRIFSCLGRHRDDKKKFHVRLFRIYITWISV